MIGTEVIHTERTTPESFELQKLFAQMADAGCTHCVMEVSSHALVLHRADEISFETGIFTNLTEDHLDFHKTMDAYCEAKAMLCAMRKRTRRRSFGRKTSSLPQTMWRSLRKRRMSRRRCGWRFPAALRSITRWQSSAQG